MAIAEQEPKLKTADDTVLVKTVLPLTWAIWFWRQARKIVVLVVGLTVVLLGVAMLVLPGPGWLTIFGGLMILATEFAWAGWILKNAKARLNQLLDAAKRQFATSTDSAKQEIRRSV